MTEYLYKLLKTQATNIIENFQLGVINIITVITVIGEQRELRLSQPALPALDLLATIFLEVVSGKQSQVFIATRENLFSMMPATLQVHLCNIKV